MDGEERKGPTSEGEEAPAEAIPATNETRKWLRIMAAMQKPWLTQPEAAFYCGVSESQFRQKKNELGLPVYDSEFGKLLFARRDLDALIEATQRVPTTAAKGERISASLRYRSQVETDLSRYPPRLARKLAKLRSD